MRSFRLRGIFMEMLGLGVLAVLLVASAFQSGSPDVARGEYLVRSVGCSDCHTPLQMGPSGPAPDLTRWLSGHPESEAVTSAPRPAGPPWMGAFSATMTAWSGPWGVSFTANLTSDKDTGLGTWVREDFINTIRTGRVLGKGRAILPPMPYDALRNFTDDDLGAMFAYLHSLPPLKNHVPDPLPPTGMAAR